MKVALLDAGTGNIGDYIQSFAVQKFLNGDPIFVPREDLVSLSSVPEPTAVVMNGWFMHKPESWPPGPKLRPVSLDFMLPLGPKNASFKANASATLRMMIDSA